MKKFALGAEVVVLALAMCVVSVVGIPLGILLAFAAMLLSLVHIDFLKGAVDCFILGLIKFARFIRNRAKYLIRVADELKAE